MFHTSEMKFTLRVAALLCCLTAASATSSCQEADCSAFAETTLLPGEKISTFEGGTNATLKERERSEVTDEGLTDHQLPVTSKSELISSRPKHFLQQQRFSASELRIRERTLDFQMYFTSVVSLSGVTTNSLSALVFGFRWGNKGQQTVTMVMIGLSITDILSMFHYTDLAIYRWSNFQSSFTMTTASGCRILIFISNWARDCSSYFILAFTVDRFVAVWFPLKKSTVITKTRMLVFMATIVITSAAAESYMLILKLVRYVPMPERCMPTSVENGRLFGLYGTIFRSSLGFLAPCIVVAILNGLVIKRIRQHNSRRASMVAVSGSTDVAAASKARSRSLTKMLLVVSTFSLACSLPKTLFFIWLAFYGNTSSLFFFTMGTAMDCISQLNYTSNFFLYCLIGSEFRKDLRKTMGKLFKKGALNKDKLLSQSGKATKSTVTE